MSFKSVKYGAIDIGSNAIRLLIATANTMTGNPPNFKKISLVRVPIRLGQDVFTTGEISEVNFNRMVDAMKAYKLLMQVHKVEKYKAYATSAMRGAQNGQEIADYIKENCGIEIEIIDGIDFKASKYFDISINRWNLDKIVPSVLEAHRRCKQMKDIDS